MEARTMTMDQTMGFFTVATGDVHYYRIAENLLRSYRAHTSAALPFAILADRENEYTHAFDKTVLLKEPTCSYLDKLALYDNLPYDINVFIDADCLAYGDLNVIFDHFQQADDFSCYGRVLPLEDRTGWFCYEDLGDLQSRVRYCVGLHGGIYYIRKTAKAAQVFAEARQIAKEYDRFHFKGRFATPGDEPILALSMALNGCRPIPFRPDGICCYWDHENDLKLDIAAGKAVLKSTGQRTHLVHWGTRFTHQSQYQKQVAALKLMENSGKRRLSNLKFDLKITAEKVGYFATRVKNKVLRVLRGRENR